MTISGISANDPATSSLATDNSLGSDSLGKDEFLKLLVDQMKNQDPMQPTDNNQMIAQLAQFSSLEQMKSLNDNVIGLAVLQQSNALLQQLTSSSALIGREVQYVDPTTQADASGKVESVRIENGVAVLSINGASVPLANVKEIGPPDSGKQSS
jgi:flagellar basal-body rod modification protein FlgD